MILEEQCLVVAKKCDVDIPAEDVIISEGSVLSSTSCVSLRSAHHLMRLSDSSEIDAPIPHAEAVQRVLSLTR